MRLSASELLNGAIFAALVVLASDAPRAVGPAASVAASEPAVEGQTQQIESEPARHGTFAARSLTESTSDATVSSDSGASTQSPGDAAPRGDAPAALRVSGEPIAATEQAVPKAAPASVKAMAQPAAQAIDAFVPPITRQRPKTPALVFQAPSEKPAKRASSKATTKAKRAVRKAADPARSSLGAGTKPKP